MKKAVLMLTTLFVFLFLTVNISLADSNTINGCVSKKDGSLRVVSATTPCKSNETSITWNITGPKGDTGATGATGSQGTAGADGHSPAVYMSGDQIAVDGTVTGPHLTGPQGTPGANGRTILNGSFDPNVLSVGSVGDFYINTSTWKIYGPKATAFSNSWGTGVQLNSAVDGMSRVVMGTVWGDGNIWNGTGFEVTKNPDHKGWYGIQFTTPFSNLPNCLCAINSLYNYPDEASYGRTETLYCRMPSDDPLSNRYGSAVFIRDSNDVPTDAFFSFICAAP